MKKILWIVTMIAIASFLFAGISCASQPAAAEKPAAEKEVKEEKVAEPIVKRPDMLDHANAQWGKDVPEWVMMDGIDLENDDAYEGKYVFKVESPRSQNLEGAKMAATNFGAMAQIAQTVSTRVQNRFSGAQVGDQDAIEMYMEQVTKTLSEAEISGLRKEREYWVQRRYYTPEGDVDEDAYTVVMLYTIDEDVLDALIKSSMDGTPPQTEEAKRAQDLVRGALSEGL